MRLTPSRWPARVLVGLVGLVTLGGAAVVGAAPASADSGGTPVARHVGSTVAVSGAVTTSVTYTPSQIAAQPQLTVADGRGGAVTGTSLEALVALSGPVYDTGKNGLLRANVSVRGRTGAARFAMGELDASFGNHPALLVVHGTGDRAAVDLVVPGDRFPLRSVRDVRAVVVATSAAIAVPPAAPGSVLVTSGRRSVTLSAETLARLPQETRTVSFLAGTGAQTHTESGPSLLLVLLVAGVWPTPGTVVTAVGSDGYGASVTPAEALVGGRSLLLSLAEDGAPLTQPRLVPDGDVKGGRYVSGTVSLVVS